MTDPFRYERADDPAASRRRPRGAWPVALVVVLVGLVVAVVLLAGGHDPSPFNHG